LSRETKARGATATFEGELGWRQSSCQSGSSRAGNDDGVPLFTSTGFAATLGAFDAPTKYRLRIGEDCGLSLEFLLGKSCGVLTDGDVTASTGSGRINPSSILSLNNYYRLLRLKLLVCVKTRFMRFANRRVETGAKVSAVR